MKVQYLKKYTDEHGFTFESGWTAEHTDAEALRRIADGICQQVSDGAYPRRQEVVVMECAVPNPGLRDIMSSIAVGIARNEPTEAKMTLTNKK